MRPPTTMTTGGDVAAGQLTYEMEDAVAELLENSC